MNPGRLWLPYCGAAPVPDALLARWNLDPWLIAALLLACGAYAKLAPDAPPRHRASFAGAMALAALLFVSPLCALSSALFSARVVHHVLLVAAVAPLLAMSLPMDRLRLRGSPAVWTAAHALVFWTWHSPPAYAWALSSDAAYWLMQSSLLVTALGFWARVRRASAPAAVAALLATMVQMGLLGALITFSGSPLYAPHLLTTLPWGLSPLEDQQLAGLIMWAPSAGIYLGAALALLGRALGGQERAAARR